MNKNNQQIFETTPHAAVNEKGRKEDDVVNKPEPVSQSQKPEVKKELPLKYHRPFYAGGKYNLLL